MHGVATAPPLHRLAQLRGVVATSDVDEQARALELIDQRYEQISGGVFAGSVWSSSRDGVTLFQESLAQSIFQTGCAAPGQLTLAAAVDISSEAYWNGRYVDTASVIGFAPGREFELRTPQRSACVGVTISKATLEQCLGPGTYEDWARRLQVADAWTDTRARSEGLSGRLVDLIDLHASMPPLAPPAQEFTETLHDLLIDVEATLGVPDAGRAGLRADAYPRIVRNARAVMHRSLEAGGSGLTIEAICLSIGCSRRALQYAFQAVLGAGPLNYLRSLRLAAVRRAFIDAPPPGTTVQDIANRYGFGHLPRFARDYAGMFGELPSTALARCRRARPGRSAAPVG